LINAFVKKTLSTLDLISKKFIIIDEIDITKHSDITDDITDDIIDEIIDNIIDDITDDIIDEIIDETDITKEIDITNDITDGIIDEIIDETDTTNEIDNIESDFKRRRFNSHDEESCDCRDLDIA
jgi:hypothetical protein